MKPTEQEVAAADATLRLTEELFSFFVYLDTSAFEVSKFVENWRVYNRAVRLRKILSKAQVADRIQTTSADRARLGKAYGIVPYALQDDPLRALGGFPITREEMLLLYAVKLRQERAR